MTEPTVACGAMTPNGPCTRRVVPGTSCGFHAPPPAPEPEPPEPPLCRCEHPVLVSENGEQDALPPRCLWCAKQVPKMTASASNI